MSKLFEIETQVIEYAKARQRLVDKCNGLQQAVDALKRGAKVDIRDAAMAAAEKKTRLEGAILAGKELFERPKTMILHGVKIGLQKGKGKLDWEDADLVVKLIKKHMPELVDTCIQVTEKPIKGALENLSVAELKKIGVTAEDTGDQVVVKPVESEVDKLIKKLSKELFQDEETGEVLEKQRCA